MPKNRQQESALWSKMKRVIPDNIHVDRVEARHPVGISDVLWNVVGEPVSGFIELKDQVQDIRPHQRIWMRRWAKQGGSVWVLARYDEVMYLIDPLEIPLNCRMDFTRAAVATDKRLPSAHQFSQIWNHILANHGARK